MSDSKTDTFAGLADELDVDVPDHILVLLRTLRLLAASESASAESATTDRDVRPLTDPSGKVTVRQACRMGVCIDATDSKALEHALTITERERDEARSALAAMAQRRREEQSARKAAEEALAAMTARRDNLSKAVEVNHAKYNVDLAHERVARLAAEKERDETRALTKELGDVAENARYSERQRWLSSPPIAEHVRGEVERAVAAETLECAKVCETYANSRTDERFTAAMACHGRIMNRAGKAAS
jgi:hypothetical protein